MVFPIRLEPWTDAVGLLRELQERDGCLVARIGPVAVALPLELRVQLERLLGKKIGLLRTDKDFRIKVVDD
jgi:hypothetical protein